MKRYKQYLEPDNTYLLPRTTRFRSYTYNPNTKAPGPSNSDSFDQHPELENRNCIYDNEGHIEDESDTNGVCGVETEEENSVNCTFGHNESETYLVSDEESMELEEGNYVDGESETATDSISEAGESDEDSDVEEHDDEGDQSRPFAPDTSPKFAENLNVPICRFLSITKAELLLLLITFTLKHNLAFAALLDLLKLINFMFSSTVLPATKHMLSKVFAHFSQRTELHFLCTFCQSYLASQTKDNQRKQYVCSNCNKTNSTQDLKSQSYFVTLPVDLQVRSLLENDNFRDSLNIRFSRETSENVLRDIYDGDMYKELSCPGGILHNNNNLSYVFNSDGSPLYKSSGTSVWPIQLAINEIPPAERRKNMILAGLWHGKGEPRMDIFIHRFVEQAKKLVTDGLMWWNKITNSWIKTKLIGLCFCVDSVARPLMQNITRFNGYNGCGFCYHPGEYICGAIRYPVGEEEHADRNAEEMIQEMEEAVRVGQSIRGVKGLSPLVNLPYFDVVYGFVPDYMHCVLLGVTKQLSKLWLEESGSEFYIGSPDNQRVVNARLSKIKPPQYIRRRPRALSERKYWKAAEWRAWLLFYALPCLKDILPAKYHFALLVQAVYLLLGDSISKDDVNAADLLLLEFVFRFQMLYGEKSMTFNVHLLHHLSVSVKNWGPLWAHSAFNFGNGNGQLVKLVKNSRGASLEIVNKFIMSKSLPVLASPDTISESTLKFCREVAGTDRLKHSHTVGDVCLLGPAVVLSLSLEEEVAVREIIQNMPVGMECNIYSRLIVNSEVIHSTDYLKPFRSNDTVVLLKDETFGIVNKILTLCFDESERCIVLLKEICPVDEPLLQNGRSRIFLPHILVCSFHLGQ